MPVNNRAALITKLQTALKKHYKPLPTGASRPLLEHVLYASLLQNAPTDLADEGMAKCEQEFFDWNEVRVTSVTELTQVLSRLPDPAGAAARLKNNLQAIFEEFYTFDLDHLKKENLGRAIIKFEKMPAMTPFVLSHTVQHGLAGHSIPIDSSAMTIMLVTGIVSQPEAKSKKVPGLERAVPKNKGIDFAGLLHQCAVALSKNPKDKTARTVLDAVSKKSSARLDQWLLDKKEAKKRVVKRKTKERADEMEAKRLAAEREEEAPAPKLGKPKPAKKGATPKAAKPEAKKAPVATKKTEPPKKPEPVKKAEPAPKPSSAKKAAPAAKKSTPKTTKKTAASKPVAKTVAPKKTASKKAPSKKTPPAKTVVKKAPAAKKKASKKAAKPSASAKKASAKKAAPKKAPVKKAAPKKSSAKKSDNRKLTKRKPR